MRSLSLPFAMLCLSVPILLLGQAPKAPRAAAAPATPSKKSALDKPVLEEYVRHLFVWGPQIQVKVGDPKPSEIPGFQQITVTASAGNASQDELFYVSKDGQKILRGMVFDMNQSPFEADL